MFLGLLNLVLVFGGVAFFTLLERKVLSYMQSRKGPKKVGILGMLQPISDAVKLFLKGFGKLLKVSLFEFYLFPLLSLILMAGFWFFFFSVFSFFSLNLGIFFFFVFLSLSVFPILGGGWASKSKYSLLGALRGAAQSISYEVSLMFTLIWILFFFNKKSFYFNNGYFMGLFFFFVFLVWLISIVCETNRAPFDFAEGESELVSGFNTEYGSFPFALLFLAEYGMMLFFSVFSSLYFFSGGLWIFVGGMIGFIFLWVRASFPRFRYDLLMSFCWGVLLPITFLLLILVKIF